MSTPSRARWNRLDHLLEEVVGKRERSVEQWRAHPQDKTEPYWQKWIAQHIDRAKRNLVARRACRSARNRKLRKMTLKKQAKADSNRSGFVLHEEPEEDEEEPYGAEANDYDWSRIDGIDGPKYRAKWLQGLSFRAQRNRDDGEKPTARRASDAGSEHHSLDYDIWMDEAIQILGRQPRMDAGFEFDGEEGPSPSNKHDGWYSQSRNAAGAAGGN